MRVSQKTVKVLLYAEGDYSFTKAWIKDLFNTRAPYEDFDITSTDFASHHESEFDALHKEINQALEDRNLTKHFKVRFLDQVDARKFDERLNGPYDLIIINFPTPSGKEKMDVENSIAQIKKNKLLTPEGKIQIGYFVHPQGDYEYHYRLAKIQKKHGLKLVKREIFDKKKYSQLGYHHILYNGEKDQVDMLTMTATYKLSAQTQERELSEKDYDELSDSEELATDAQPYRHSHGESSHRHQVLNFRGSLKKRAQWCDEQIDKDPKKYTNPVINDLILRRNYREADRRITMLMESSKGKSFESDSVFGNWVLKTIDEAYEKFQGTKPSNKALENYHPWTWYSKLKVLTGVHIPELINRFTIR